MNFNLKLTGFNDDKNIGLIQTSTEAFEWRLTKSKWNEFREKLTAMYRNGSSGHYYLDSDSSDNKDLQVVFSWGEYPLSFWEKYKKGGKSVV